MASPSNSQNQNTSKIPLESRILSLLCAVGQQGLTSRQLASTLEVSHKAVCKVLLLGESLKVVKLVPGTVFCRWSPFWHGGSKQIAAEGRTEIIIIWDAATVDLVQLSLRQTEYVHMSIHVLRTPLQQMKDPPSPEKVSNNGVVTSQFLAVRGSHAKQIRELLESPRFGSPKLVNCTRREIYIISKDPEVKQEFAQMDSVIVLENPADLDIFLS